MSKPSRQPRDVYQEVTDRIVSALEQGTAPWVRPWDKPVGGFPRNGATGRHYHGINVFLLWMAADAAGYGSDEWFTYKQAQAQGAQVRKGERGSLVTFWKRLTVREEQRGGEETGARFIPLLRHFIVFNRAQIDGLAPAEATVAPRNEWERMEGADTFIRASGAKIREGGARACYVPALDEIRLPELSAFHNRESYYSTALHELAHWTGHPSRLARDFSGSFGTPDYAREELVAEMGAAFLCAALGISGQLQHPEYIGSWLKKLREDKRAIFRAASQARQVAEYLGATEPAGDREEGEDAAALAA